MLLHQTTIKCINEVRVLMLMPSTVFDLIFTREKYVVIREHNLSKHFTKNVDFLFKLLVYDSFVSCSDEDCWT